MKENDIELPSESTECAQQIGAAKETQSQKPRRYFLGRPVYTAEDRFNRECPLAPEPEWIEEAKRIRASMK